MDEADKTPKTTWQKRYAANKEKEKERKRLYYLNNKEKVTKRNKRWADANPERVKAINAKFKKDNPDKLKVWFNNWRSRSREHEKQYRKDNASRLKENGLKWKNMKYKTDPLFRLQAILRSSIIQTFRLRGHKKSGKTIDILGCTFEEFKAYIESKFEPWMTWENQGLYNGTCNFGWDLDHIIAASTAMTKEDVIRLNHFTNFQPLCTFTNRFIKSNKTDWKMPNPTDAPQIP